MRTDPTKVRAALNTDDSVDVTNYIRTAGTVVDYLVSQDSRGILTSGLLIEIETYLAAHFCALFDAQYIEKATDAASGVFVRAEPGQGFMGTDWGQQAVALDVTGVLAGMTMNSPTVTMEWLGLPQSAKTEWQDRN